MQVIITVMNTTEKVQACAGVERVTSGIPVHCST